MMYCRILSNSCTQIQEILSFIPYRTRPAPQIQEILPIIPYRTRPAPQIQEKVSFIPHLSAPHKQIGLPQCLNTQYLISNHTTVTPQGENNISAG